MITSKDNELIKKCIDLQSKKYSRLENKCFVESVKLVKELYSRGLVETILVVKSKFEQVSNLKCKIEIISDSLAKLISSTVTTDGVFAVCRLPNHNSVTYNKCLILDRIQDPSNLGAIIRSACAFGFKTIFTINSVYPFTPKSIRSSMGYVFDVDFFDFDVNSLKELKDKHNITFYAADMGGELIDNVKLNNNNLALIIGNEGQGIDKDLRVVADKIVAIPMENNVESLNASVSASIIMYFLR